MIPRCRVRMRDPAHGNARCNPLLAGTWRPCGKGKSRARGQPAMCRRPLRCAAQVHVLSRGKSPLAFPHTTPPFTCGTSHRPCRQQSLRLAPSDEQQKRDADWIPGDAPQPNTQHCDTGIPPRKTMSAAPERLAEGVATAPGRAASPCMTCRRTRTRVFPKANPTRPEFRGPARIDACQRDGCKAEEAFPRHRQRNAGCRNRLKRLQFRSTAHPGCTGHNTLTQHALQRSHVAQSPTARIAAQGNAPQSGNAGRCATCRKSPALGGPMRLREMPPRMDNRPSATAKIAAPTPCVRAPHLFATNAHMPSRPHPMRKKNAPGPLAPPAHFAPAVTAVGRNYFFLSLS
jgi:hypothetical protein